MMQQPAMQQQQQPFPYQQLPNNPDYTNFDFSNPIPTDQTYSDPSAAFDNNNFSYGLNNQQPQTYGSNLAQGSRGVHVRVPRR